MSDDAVSTEPAAAPAAGPLRALRWLRVQPPLVRIFFLLDVLAIGVLLPSPLRALVVIPIVLTTPGYAAMLAIRPGLDRDDRWLRAALSVALSLALLAITSVLLLVSGIGISAASALISLLLVSMGFAVVTPWDERARPAAGDEPPAAPRQRLRAIARAPVAVLLGALASAVLVVGAVIVAVPAAPAAGYSSIALDGVWARTAGPVVVAPGQLVAVPLVVENHEHVDLTYQLRPSVLGATWQGVSVKVPAGGSGRASVTGSIPAGGCLHRLIVRLTTTDGRVAIDGPTIWLQGRPSLPAACKKVGLER